MYFNKALEAAVAAHGEGSAETATYLKSFGDFYSDCDRHEDAFNCYQQALGIQKEKLGKHPTTASTMNALGEICAELGAYDAAMDYLLPAMAIRQEILGPDHNTTSVSYLSVGKVFKSLGQFQEVLCCRFGGVLIIGRQCNTTTMPLRYAALFSDMTIQTLPTCTTASQWCALASETLSQLWGTCGNAWKSNNVFLVMITSSLQQHTTTLAQRSRTWAE